MSDEEWVGPFRQCGLELLLNDPNARVRSIETGTPALVAVPGLGIGQQMLAHIPVRQESAAPVDYISRTPWLCVYHDVTVHGLLGIVRIDDFVVADTVAWHGRGAHHRQSGDGVLLRSGGVRRTLSGACISLLGTLNASNYYHWTIDGIGRLSAMDAATLCRCRHVLVPPLTTEFQRTGIALAGLSGMDIIEVADGDELAVEELIVPWPPMEDYRPHPGLRAFFTQMPIAATTASGPWPARFYIDRRHSNNRQLVNEDEVAAALQRKGFAPVRLELLTMADQVALFRNASCVVAPHGAGLTNLIFAPSSCRVVELQMDFYIHWAFRVIAALGSLPYDCVIGRQLPEREGTVHDQRWAVSVTHVMAAVEAALGARCDRTA